MSLELEIFEWDLKSVCVIAGIYQRYVGEEDFLDTLVQLIANEKLQSAATWLVKHHLENSSEPLSPDLVEEYYGHVDKLVHWQARLHVLQCMSRLAVSKSRLQRVEAFVRECMGSEKKFVRAWGYSGFYELGVQYPRYQAEAIKILGDALEIETAGSVRSRLRTVLKQGFKP